MSWQNACSLGTWVHPFKRLVSLSPRFLSAITVPFWRLVVHGVVLGHSCTRTTVPQAFRPAYIFIICLLKRCYWHCKTPIELIFDYQCPIKIKLIVFLIFFQLLNHIWWCSGPALTELSGFALGGLWVCSGNWPQAYACSINTPVCWAVSLTFKIIPKSVIGVFLLFTLHVKLVTFTMYIVIVDTLFFTKWIQSFQSPFISFYFGVNGEVVVPGI